MTTSPASPASRDAHDSWQDLDDTLQSIVELSRGDLGESSFYREFLNRCTTVLNGSSPCVWRLAESGDWIRQHEPSEHGDPFQLSPERIQSIADGGLPLLVFETPTQNHHPRQCAALVCPIQIGDSITAVVEMWKLAQESGDGLQRDLQFLEAACEMAGDYHGHQELRRLKQSELQWRELSPFVDRIHASLDPTTVCFTLANEGRRILDCDRLSVVLYRAGRFHLTAVSGQDSIDHRANAVRMLEKLAASVHGADGELWWDPCSADPPSETVQTIVEETGCELLAVVPLQLETEEHPAAEPAAGPIGVLVLQQFQSQHSVEHMRSGLLAIRAPCARALHNALLHQNQPFHRLTSRLKPLLNPIGRRRYGKRALAIGIALTVVAALGLIPADLTVPANGRLLPAHRQHVFAEANGVVRALKTGHGSHVEKGDVLATLSSSELDFEITESLGALQTAAKRLSTIRSARLAMTPSDAAARREYNRLTAEEEATKAEIEGLKAQQSILTQRKSTLLVKSPLSGTVLTWDVARKLEARPVQRGEILMTVAQLNNDWIVELDVPDDRIGYVCQARDKTQADQPVELVLATDPTTKYSATIRSIALRSEPDQQGHPTVRVTAALDQRINTGLRPGAMVVARIHCGPRSLGFVWFHDLLEVIRTRVLF